MSGSELIIGEGGQLVANALPVRLDTQVRDRHYGADYYKASIVEQRSYTFDL